MNGWVRATLWTAGFLITVIVAFQMRIGIEPEGCEGGSDCDLTGLAAAVWSISAATVYLVIVCIAELIIRRRRKERAHS